MGIDVYVNGIKPPGEKFKSMLGIYKDCKNLGVSIPSEVIDFFEGRHPNEKGVIVPLKGKGYEFINEGDASVLYIELDNLPKDVKILRVSIE